MKLVSSESTVDLDTKSAILTVEAQHAGGQADIQAALEYLSLLLARFVGGSFKTGVRNIPIPALTGQRIYDV